MAIKWRQKKMCHDCGFCGHPEWEQTKRENPVEWQVFQQYVLQNLASEQVYCHNTPAVEGEPTLLCAGIIAYQIKHCGRPSDIAVRMQQEHGESL